MARLVFWLLLALGGWWLFRTGGRVGRAPPPGAAPPPAAGAAPMLQCAYCGLHFPRGDGQDSRDGRHFCSLAHQQSALHADPK